VPAEPLDVKPIVRVPVVQVDCPRCEGAVGLSQRHHYCEAIGKVMDEHVARMAAAITRLERELHLGETPSDA
jgi:hypothetical protein